LDAGHSVPTGYKDRLSYISYGGSVFPFPDNSFDIVFSWGAFEHISNPRASLLEARRVVKPTGRIFIVVYPWFHSFHGGHLADYISEPYFHLHRSDGWVWERLNEFLANHPEQAEKPLRFWRPEGYTLRSFLCELMWREYRALNRYSARRFFRDAVDIGLIIEKVETHIENHPAASAVQGTCYADLVTAGNTVLLLPGKSADSAPINKSWLSAVRDRFNPGWG
jgi:SAM-dependent methyltransferase